MNADLDPQLYVQHYSESIFFPRLCSDDSDGEEGGSSNNHHQVVVELDNKSFTPVEVPEGEHRLQSQYCLWYSRRKGDHDPMMDHG